MGICSLPSIIKNSFSLDNNNQSLKNFDSIKEENEIFTNNELYYYENLKNTYTEKILLNFEIKNKQNEIKFKIFKIDKEENSNNIDYIYYKSFDEDIKIEFILNIYYEKNNYKILVLDENKEFYNFEINLFHFLKNKNDSFDIIKNGTKINTLNIFNEKIIKNPNNIIYNFEIDCFFNNEKEYNNNKFFFILYDSLKKIIYKSKSLIIQKQIKIIFKIRNLYLHSNNFTLKFFKTEPKLNSYLITEINYNKFLKSTVEFEDEKFNFKLKIINNLSLTSFFEYINFSLEINTIFVFNSKDKINYEKIIKNFQNNNFITQHNYYNFKEKKIEKIDLIKSSILNSFQKYSNQNFISIDLNYYDKIFNLIYNNFLEINEIEENDKFHNYFFILIFFLNDIEDLNEDFFKDKNYFEKFYNNPIWILFIIDDKNEENKKTILNIQNLISDLNNKRNFINLCNIHFQNFINYFYNYIPFEIEDFFEFEKNSKFSLLSSSSRNQKK